MSTLSKRDRKTLLYIVLIALCVILIIFLLSRIKAEDKKEPATVTTKGGSITFFDVGQGDGALIKDGDNEAIIDNGTPENAYDFCEKLKKMGVDDIEYMLLTHNHDDHMGGSEAVANTFDIENLFLPDLSGTKSPTRILNAVSEKVQNEGGAVSVAKSGLFYNVGEIKLSVLSAYYELSDENDRSVIVIAELNGKKFLFTGDAGSAAEKRMLNEGIDFDCDVLKVGHHGSKGSSTAAFLMEATPLYAVISCGEGNVYRHPHDEALKRLVTSGAKVLRTDICGDITFYADSELHYKTEK
ncbi:MAG: MBL fold metallo-hydrolase [Clostridia bacterium]|nr:MBL fold metallo-hydrolase [Clostridia bacterium]